MIAPRGLLQRQLGAYYTPSTLAEAMADWAVRHERDTILEPSIGDGRFAIAARHLAEERGWGPPEIHAAELDPDTAAGILARGVIPTDRLLVGDFLAGQHLPRVDVVIGNPPYVRLRNIDEDSRRVALDAYREATGLELGTSASLWAPFVAKATSLLRPGGRLALVLPLDLTHVQYARPLWQWLAGQFSELTVWRFRERLFDINQQVVVLLADGKGGTTEFVHSIAHEHLDDLGKVAGLEARLLVDDVVRGKPAFRHALLPTTTREVSRLLVPASVPVRRLARFSNGHLSGHNEFFYPTPETIRRFDLPERSLHPAIETSRQLADLGLTIDHSHDPPSRLWLPEGELSTGERAYIEHGESIGVHQRYKCRVRTPWWVVPGVRRPRVLIGGFSDTPRLHIGHPELVTSHSTLGGTLADGLAPDSFAGTWYTPWTLLQYELTVRALGGGMFNAVPGELGRVTVLDPTRTPGTDLDLADRHLQAGRNRDTYRAGDRAILGLVGRPGLDAVWEGAETLARWRRS